MKKGLLRILCFGAAAVWSSQAMAQFQFFDMYVEVGVNEEYQSASAFGFETTPPTEPVTLEYSVPEIGGGGGTSHVDFGVNKASLHFETADDDNNGNVIEGTAWADTYDRILISNPELNGTKGVFTASFAIDGTTGLGVNGFAGLGDFDILSAFVEWEAFIGVSADGEVYDANGWLGGTYYDSFTNEVVYDGDPLNALQTEISFEFTYGEEFYMMTSLGVRGFFSYLSFEDPVAGSASGSVDLSHTATWQGMKIYDAEGNEVTDFDLTSLSGTDWSKPVPEPVTMAALAIGVAGLLRKRRKAA